MYQQKEEDDLKLLQKFIPDATPEKLHAFQKCMSTDAVYKSAVPYGLAGIIAAHLLIPKKVGVAKPIITGIIGLTTYMFGKLMYAPVCTQRAFGVTSQTIANNANLRNRFPHTSDNVDNFYQQDHESKYNPNLGNPIEEQFAWNNFDSSSESSDTFDDTNSHAEGGLTNEQQSNEKRRVTYDDLWVEHQDRQTKNQYRNYMGAAPLNRSMPVTPQRYRASEDSIAPETELREKDIWS